MSHKISIRVMHYCNLGASTVFQLCRRSWTCSKYMFVKNGTKFNETGRVYRKKSTQIVDVECTEYTWTCRVWTSQLTRRSDHWRVKSGNHTICLVLFYQTRNKSTIGGIRFPAAKVHGTARLATMVLKTCSGIEPYKAQQVRCCNKQMATYHLSHQRV